LQPPLLSPSLTILITTFVKFVQACVASSVVIRSLSHPSSRVESREEKRREEKRREEKRREEKRREEKRREEKRREEKIRE
jgi:hypothetical protein